VVQHHLLISRSEDSGLTGLHAALQQYPYDQGLEQGLPRNILLLLADLLQLLVLALQKAEQLFLLLGKQRVLAHELLVLANVLLENRAQLLRVRGPGFNHHLKSRKFNLYKLLNNRPSASKP